MATDLQIAAVGNVNQAANIKTELDTSPTASTLSDNASSQIATQFASALASKEPANVVPELSVAKKFEAVFVAQMMASILPEDSEYFGEGFAGDAWRSMLSEQLANVAVKQSDFGIASLIDQNGMNQIGLGRADQSIRFDISSDLLDTPPRQKDP